MIGVPTNIKNMYIGGDVPGEVYIKNPEGHTTISGSGYVTASGMNLQLSALGSTSFSMNNGDGNTVTATLSNAGGKRLFGMPTVSFYETTQTATNSIPDGSSIAASDYVVTHWIDWGASDNSNIVMKSWIKNNTGGTQTILYRIQYRYLVDKGGLS